MKNVRLVCVATHVQRRRNAVNSTQLLVEVEIVKVENEWFEGLATKIVLEIHSVKGSHYFGSQHEVSYFQN